MIYNDLNDDDIICEAKFVKCSNRHLTATKMKIAMQPINVFRALASKRKISKMKKFDCLRKNYIFDLLLAFRYNASESKE